MAELKANLPNVINSTFLDTSNMESYAKEFATCKPFPLVRMESFLNKEFIPKLESSLNENITFAKKDNDLFRFYQSYDLQQLPANTPVQHLIQSLYSNQFIDLLFKITGIKVGNKPDLFASCYNNTSYLLCHDDQIEDRRIAFILYLVPENWSKSDGGALNIYDSYNVNDISNTNSNSSNAVDSNNFFPRNKPLKQLIPKRNSVVLFKVSDTSFHSVSEVLSDKNRIAIGGWWHDCEDSQMSDSVMNKVPISDPMIIWQDCISNKDSNNALLQKWINPTYLKQKSMDKLREKFCEESHLTLISFINESLYYKLLKQMFAIKCESDNGDSHGLMQWKLNGPIHRRLYYKLAKCEEQKSSDESECDLVLEFQRLMQSKEWKLFIAKITCVDLLKYSLEIRKFEHGHYTIAHDLDRFKDMPGLDINLQFIESEEQGWNPMFGGSIYYTLENTNETKENGIEIIENENETGNESELGSETEDESIIMSVHTFPNTLSITYRSEGGVMSFVKYINHKAPCAKIDFNQIWSVDDTCQSESEEGNEQKRKLEQKSDDLKDEPQHKRQKL